MGKLKLSLNSLARFFPYIEKAFFRVFMKKYRNLKQTVNFQLFIMKIKIVKLWMQNLFFLKNYRKMKLNYGWESTLCKNLPRLNIWIAIIRFKSILMNLLLISVIKRMKHY